ncbi:MAG: rane protein involved in aromatic hydrocarbon degradation [Betaproteobacteria bacterium]|nr:rane protein involved in aromatic hydrocarbon degradation [Betaproteobacteria bacterium]
MPLPKFNRKALVVALAPVLAAAPMAAHAGGFALLESSASGLGTSYAGSAVEAVDASTIFYNPAGLSYLPGYQFVGSVDLIQPSAKFNNSGSLPSGSNPFGQPNPVRPLGGNGGDAGSLAPVPALFLSAQVAPQWTIGLGVNAPFGQKTDYSPDWIGRFQALKSEIKTINVNPTVAYKVNDAVSLGFGVNYQRIDAEFSQAVNYAGAAFGGALQLGLAPAVANGAAGLVKPEGTGTVKGSDSAWGWNAGAIVKLAPQTRLGIAYRSAIKYHVTGTANFTNVTVTGNPAFDSNFASGNIHADVKLPDSLSASLMHELNSRWTLMGNVSWTGWSSIKDLTFVRDNGVVLSSTRENFRDTWRVGLGATYRVDDKWLLRGGTAYDQSPVRDDSITPRLPDQARYWLSLGAQYRMSPAMTFDVGYAHLFAKDRSINQNNGSTLLYGQINGTYNVSVDILGAQVAYRF